MKNIRMLVDEFNTAQRNLADACAKAHGYGLDGGISWAHITTMSDGYGNAGEVVCILTDSNESSSYCIPIEEFNKEIQ